MKSTADRVQVDARVTEVGRTLSAPLEVLPLAGRILLSLLTAAVQRAAAWLRDPHRKSSRAR